MPLPLVSVIIPAYNHELFIAEAIDSVTGQDYPHLEIVVVDDGSQDATYAQAEQSLARCGRPYRLVHQENRGAHAALNYGISLAQGEYIAILNSDDRYHPRRISTLIRDLQESGSRFAFSQVRHIDDGGNPHPYHPHYRRLLADAERFPSMSFALLLNNLTVTTGNFVMHRSLYEDVGPFAPYITCHDWDYVLRVILHEEPLYVPQELMDYRIHARNTLKEHLALVEQEGIEVRRAYLENVKDAKNPLAPGPKQWGPYWRFFVRHYLLPMYMGTELEALLTRSMERDGPVINFPTAYLRLAETIERIAVANEKLESAVTQLNEEITLLRGRFQEMEDQLRAPLYFAIRKRLLPWYRALGGEKVAFLSRLKNLVKRTHGIE